MLLRELNPALLLIDIQKGFEDIEYWGGNRNNMDAEKKSAQILQMWRELSLPIFHIQHSSQDPDSKLHRNNQGFAIKDEVKPLENEVVIVKDVNSAFIGTDLKERLDNENISTLVIVGLTTNHCVSTTTRMAGNFGYTTYLISDATATFDRKGIDGELYSADLIHKTTLANLMDEFASVFKTDELLEKL